MRTGQFPFQYLLATLLVVFESTLYMYGFQQMPSDGCGWLTKEYPIGGKDVTITAVDPDGPAARAGLKKGDKLLSVGGYTPQVLFSWKTLDHFAPGESVRYEIEREGRSYTFDVTLDSVWSHSRSFYLLYYSLISIVAAIGVFVLFKKPLDPSARLFFVFSQVFAICLNSQFAGAGWLATIRSSVFAFSFPFLGTSLFHFFLLFPDRARAHSRYPALVWFVYGTTLAISILLSLLFVRFDLDRSPHHLETFIPMLHVALGWMGLTLLASLLLAIRRFLTTHEVVRHNQLRWVMVGVVFGLLPETIFGFYPELLWALEPIIPFVGEFTWSVGAIILLTSLAFAITKYRIWDIELIIRRGLIYGSVSLGVIALYLGTVVFAERFLAAETNPARVVGLLISALFFIPIRELAQRRIDKIFHREPYDPAQAALHFEEYLTGLYDIQLLHQAIVDRLDEIFHFKTLFLFLREREPDFALTAQLATAPEGQQHRFSADEPFLEHVSGRKVAALSELPEDVLSPSIPHGELLVPLRYSGELRGFLLCGAKRSEKHYSHQDIQLLSLLAQRSSAALLTAELYRKELERQLMIERERSRISKDMHDEIGASLTKIAIVSELLKKDFRHPSKARSHVNRISEAAREVVDSLSEIIWAVNPQNDTLDTLAAYIREYASDFFEPTRIRCRFSYPEVIPPVRLSAEFRRNVFLITKESLNNVVKHSRATEVFIQVALLGQRFELSIEDNGKGFDMSHTRRFAVGLESMRKRAEDVKAAFVIASRKKSGARVSVTASLPPSAT